MPVSGGGFEQCYNAQAGSPISLPPLVPCAAASAVEIDSRLIPSAALRAGSGQRVSDAPNDKEQLVPSLAGSPLPQPPLFPSSSSAVASAAGPVAEVLIDSGFLSEAAVRAAETAANGQPSGVRVLAAMGREPFGRLRASRQSRPRVPRLPPARPGRCRDRMDPAHPRLQPAPPPPPRSGPERRLSRPARRERLPTGRSTLPPRLRKTHPERAATRPPQNPQPCLL